MKASATLLLIATLTFGACQTTEKEPNAPIELVDLAENNAIKAVESNKEYGSLSRTYTNVVNLLYEALLDKNKSLQNLEDAIDELHEDVSLKQSEWTAFVLKNQGYYQSAHEHAQQMTDSTMMHQLVAQIDKSRDVYQIEYKKGELKWDQLHETMRMISDNQTMLKVQLTIPIIEKYQNGKGVEVMMLDSLIKTQTLLVDKVEEILETT